ncbi:unnamed protein product, partial [Rotaria sp. Silwood1]
MQALTCNTFNSYTATRVKQFNKTTVANFRANPGSDNYETFSGIYQQNVNLIQTSFMSDMIITLTDTLPNASALNISSSSSRFDPTTTISVIFDNLMLESWHNSTDFAAYFRTCAPKTCSYSYEQRFYLIYMITVVASLFGGLSKVLHVTSPLLVKCILRLCRQQVRTFEADEGRESSTNCQGGIWNI